MNLQNVLGTMLATGMGGRSGFGADGIGQVLSNTGFGGLSEGMSEGGMPQGMTPEAGSSRHSGMGFKEVAGLGALGYLAYRALQERRQNQQDQGGTGAQDTGGGGGLLGSIFGGVLGGGAAASAGGGGLGDRLSRMLGGSQQQQQQAPAEAYPNVAMEDQHALLLIRAMITAANADGQISQDERQRILSATQGAGMGSEEARVLQQELDNPQPLDTLLQQVRDPEASEQVYLASCAAIDQSSETGRAYLGYLASRLQISPERLQRMHAA